MTKYSCVNLCIIKEYEGGAELKSSYDGVISAVDVFNRWYLSTATSIVEVCGP